MNQINFTGLRIFSVSVLLTCVVLCGTACSFCKSEQLSPAEENVQPAEPNVKVKPKPADHRKERKYSNRPFNKRPEYDVNPYGYLFQN